MEERHGVHDDEMRVLVVDDEKNILDILQTFLENEGYTVCVAESGAEAMQNIEECMPQIVLLDIRMPDIDGIQCLRTIKDNYSGVEVVMMSGFATTRMALKSLQIGAFDYIGKPIEFGHLKEIIEQIKITKFLEKM